MKIINPWKNPMSLHNRNFEVDKPIVEYGDYKIYRLDMKRFSTLTPPHCWSGPGLRRAPAGRLCEAARNGPDESARQPDRDVAEEPCCRALTCLQI